MAYPCFTVSTMLQLFHMSNMVSIMHQTNVLTGAHNLLSKQLPCASFAAQQSLVICMPKALMPSLQVWGAMNGIDAVRVTARMDLTKT